MIWITFVINKIKNFLQIKRENLLYNKCLLTI